MLKSCADRSEATVILLHVVHLNILSPEARIYDELVADARHYLERLARDYLADIPGVQVRVRIGKPVVHRPRLRANFKQSKLGCPIRRECRRSALHGQSFDINSR